jgi:hydrogenase maturation protease
MSALCEAPARVFRSHPERGGRTLVLALGSTLRGDDGVGAAVLDELAARGRLPRDVDLLDGGTPGLEIALLLEGYQRAIIIDAADMGRRPGEWARLAVDRNSCLGREQASGDLVLEPTSIHQVGVAEALVLGAALGVIPESVVVYGVQPLECGWSAGLSPAVQAAVAGVCRAIEDEIGSREAAGRGEREPWRRS